jgi:hypothetical protein
VPEYPGVALPKSPRGGQEGPDLPQPPSGGPKRTYRQASERFMSIGHQTPADLDHFKQSTLNFGKIVRASGGPRAVNLFNPNRRGGGQSRGGFLAREDCGKDGSR